MEAGYLPGDQVCLGMDVEGCQSLHDLHHVHGLGHPRVKEAHVSIDTAKEATVRLAVGPGALLGPRGGWRLPCEVSCW